MAAKAPAWRDTMKRGALRGGALLGAIALALGALLCTLALISYHPSDAALNTAAGGPAANLLGTAGAWFADLALSAFGPAFGLIVPLLLVTATRLWRGAMLDDWLARCIRVLLGIALIGTALALFRPEAFAGLPGGLGGVIGYAAAQLIALGVALLPLTFIAPVSYSLVALLAITGAIVWAMALGLDADERAWLFRRRVRAEPRALEPVREPARAPRAEAGPRHDEVPVRRAAAVENRPHRLSPIASLRPPPRALMCRANRPLISRINMCCRALICLRPRHPRRAICSTRPRSSAMRGCSKPCSTIFMSKARSSKCAPARS